MTETARKRQRERERKRQRQSPRLVKVERLIQQYEAPLWIYLMGYPSGNRIILRTHNGIVRCVANLCRQNKVSEISRLMILVEEPRSRIGEQLSEPREHESVCARARLKRLTI